jgi:cytidylate kinase
MGEVVVVTGPPGAGKSTVADLLASRLEPSALVTGDLFFTFVRNGWVDPWLPEAEEQNRVVIRAAAQAVGPLAGRYHVVYDGVVGPWYLQTFLAVSGLEHLHYAVLFPPLSVCRDRVATRKGHGFTDMAATEHMWRDFEGSLHGMAPHVLDGTASPASLARTIADGVVDGRLRYR